MKQFAIFGVGGCGRGVLPLVRQQLQAELLSGIAELVFVDDQPSTGVVNGHRVLSYTQWLAQSVESQHISLAISNSSLRQKLVNRCMSDGLKFFEVRANNVVLMDDVQLGEGAVLCPFVTITSNVRIGKHFHANLYSYIEHDCVIGDYVTFAPSVKCNGNVHIQDHAYIGAGAVIKQGQNGDPLIIGSGAVIGMGTVVTKSVLPGVTVIGNPARELI